MIAVLFLLFTVKLYAQHRDVPATGSFTITGAVKSEKVVTLADLQRYIPKTLDNVVLKNHKGEIKDTLKDLQGIALKDLLASSEIVTEKPKEYSEYCIVLSSSDGYKNVYSWNEIFNTAVGDNIYIITALKDKTLYQMDQRILVMSLADINTGRRYMKGLSKIEFKKL